MAGALARLTSFTGRVKRSEYVAAGFLLLAVKYAVDTLVLRLAVGVWWPPLDYLNPIYNQRLAVVSVPRELPAALLVFTLLWGILFAWIGASWSARRALDAGLSPWWSLAFFVPFLNFVLILFLSLVPTRELPPAERPATRQSSELGFRRTLLGAFGLLPLLGLAFFATVQWGSSYGLTAFVSLPFAYGVGIGYLLNREGVRGAGTTAGFAMACTVIACLTLLLAAAEGLVCVLMAFPVVYATTVSGAIFGRVLALVSRSGRPLSPGLVLLLPLVGWLDSSLPSTPPRRVTTSVEIDAPPEVVWKHVISFPDLPEPGEWLFRTGIAYPKGARLEGRGVGAVRHCEFTTGAFVEPITVWDEPRHLAFDVLDQPVPMHEWSFYEEVHPPHLDGSFRSLRGEFRLTPLPGGRTRLEGSTWYLLELAPEAYWCLWTDPIVHAIHRRVLRHVRGLAEASGD